MSDADKRADRIRMSLTPTEPPPKVETFRPSRRLLTHFRRLEALRQQRLGNPASGVAWLSRTFAQLGFAGALVVCLSCGLLTGVLILVFTVHK
jgi:hypothetical protein